MWVMSNLVSVHLETMLVSVQDNFVSIRLDTMLMSVQDRCTVYGKCAIGSGSFWTKQMELPGDEAQVDARFGLFGDSANLDARYVHGLR
jgi:hypothetical protein